MFYTLYISKINKQPAQLLQVNEKKNKPNSCIYYKTLVNPNLTNKVLNLRRRRKQTILNPSRKVICLRIKQVIILINFLQEQRRIMGCQSSQVVAGSPEVKISIIDSGFMKPENESIQKQMRARNIQYDYFISLDCFLDEFSKRYYNQIVTTQQHYNDLNSRLKKLNFSPKLYVIMEKNKTEERLPDNIRAVNDYSELVRVLQQRKSIALVPNTQEKEVQKKVCQVFVLCKPGARNSEESIFESALKKSNISFDFFTNYQIFEESLNETEVDFIVTDYIYHREVVHLAEQRKSRVICYCDFDKSQSYASDLYSVSNNYLEITADIKSELKLKKKNSVKCTKIYLCTSQLPEYREIKQTIQDFGVEVRTFNNYEKVIKETTYFFCVTVVAVDSKIKGLKSYFEDKDYGFRIKFVSIPAQSTANIKGLSKVIRNIKKGYKLEKDITRSIDIIDKHYDNVKFEQIKKELDSNNIACFGFQNLSNYIKNKKLISPFIICNFEERNLLHKYLRQLKSRSKIIIFCNKNKIGNEVNNNSSFAFVSSHFGKIIKFIKKTHVFIPLIEEEQKQKLNENLEKVKVKNKRISALKWGMVGEQNGEELTKQEETFEFLNISQSTRNGSITDIQKSISQIWKIDSHISSDLNSFKKSFASSLAYLHKVHKISYPLDKFNIILEEIKSMTLGQLAAKTKDFFNAENQLGLEINKSLIRTESLDKTEIINMRQFLLLALTNYFSGYRIPRVGKTKLKHWISTPLIQKCEVGSFIFCKNFLIFYEDNLMKMDKLSKYKIELELEYDMLNESEILLNSFITEKDKHIFCPFSKFQVQGIIDAGDHKIVTVKYIKNLEFIKCRLQENLFEPEQSLKNFAESLEQTEKLQEFVGAEGKQNFKNNLKRCQSINCFKNSEIDQAISIHKDLIKHYEEQENLDSVLINQLHYQLACFYFKDNQDSQTAHILKDLMESNPNSYIKEQCEKMIEQVTKEPSEVSGEENEERVTHGAKSRATQRKISDQTMKTFAWLKNKELSDSEEEESLSDKGSEIQEHEQNIFENVNNCIQIQEYELNEKENTPS